MKQINYRTSHKQRRSYSLNHTKKLAKNNSSKITSLIAIFTGVISIVSISTRLLQKELLKGYCSYFNLDSNLASIINDAYSLIDYFLIYVTITLGCILLCYFIQKIKKWYLRMLIFISIALIIPGLRVGYTLYLSQFISISLREIIKIGFKCLTDFIQILVMIFIFNCLSKDFTEEPTPSSHTIKNYLHR